MTKVGAVLVIGGGISGMQASLDLAEAGFKVYLVEKSPSIGGRMAQLDKTFPTNDCAMCTMAPKMVEVTRHPDIEVLAYSEVTSVKGKEGNFKATIKRKSRYIVEDKCTGCGLCAEVCPIKLPNEFDENIGSRKAAYIPFPQGAPLVYTIDMKYCTQCGMCKIICEADCIDYDLKEEELEIEVGNIILSTGYELFNPAAVEEYGYGLYPNVLTNLQFERLLSASGPTGGHVIRPSDGKDPKSIAFIQCVGSRDVRHYPYCSKICCMASTKEAIVAKEHNPELKSYILYMDLRSFGKGFQEYVNKAKNDYGAEYIRGRVAQVIEDPETRNLKVLFENTMLGEPQELEVDMVVLASALKPSGDAKKLAGMLGIDSDEYGFFNEKAKEDPSSTAVDGVYITGACQGPKDIPDSVVQGSGTAAKCGSMLKDAKNSLITIKEKVSEKEISGEPRVGVFVCHCGLNIASVIDVAEVAEYAKTLPNVVHSTDTMYACADVTLTEIKKEIKKHNLNRLIIASCTPRTHEPLFRETSEEAGLNPYLFEMANIREHCSWVHSKEPEKATEKAKELVRMAVGRSRILRPQQREEVDIENSAVVVGGGVAGMTAALEIANQGFKVHLLENGKELGGHVNNLSSVFLERRDPGEVLNPMKEEVEKHPNIKVHLESTLDRVDGFTGNFDVALSGKERIRAGGIVLATGSQEFKPRGSYLYGKSKDVMTLLELEDRMKDGTLDYKDIAFIMCVGARNEERPYCSRYCCGEAVKNAIALKEKNPKANVYIIYRDMMMFGKDEEYYKKSAEEYGIKYLKYVVGSPPRVEEDGDKLKVVVNDAFINEDLELSVDKVVLATPRVPPEGMEDLQKVLKVPRSPDGFFMEAHAKLRPLEFVSSGIYLCGDCQGPKELSLTISQASGAAAKVCALLSKEMLKTEATVAVVDEELCIGCGRCVDVCAFDAISLEKNKKGEYKALVNSAVCTGCGACASVCPNAAITPRHFGKDQLMVMIDELLEAA